MTKPLLNFSHIALLVCMVAFLLLASGVRAENNEINQNNDGEVAKKYNFTFPVAELGNCQNLTECKSYCSDQTHAQACAAFANSHRINTQNPVAEAAKSELGCDYASTCKDFCSKEENKDKCKAFAEKYFKNKPPKLEGPKAEGSPSAEILNKAKQFLGCDSYDECKAFCSKEENKPKCAEFSRTLSGKNSSEKGPQGGPQQPGPQSAQACLDFCKTNPTQCYQTFQQYAPTASSSSPLKSHGTLNSVTYAKLYSACTEAGCKWTGKACLCQGGQDEQGPKPLPAKTPASTSANISTSTVKGASTGPGFFQWVLNLFNH